MTITITCGLYFQRSAGYERQIEQLRQQLVDAVQGSSVATDSHMQEPTPDMQHAIDILKRSSLEVELAAKEGEVGRPMIWTSLVVQFMWKQLSSDDFLEAKGDSYSRSVLCCVIFHHTYSRCYQTPQ